MEFPEHHPQSAAAQRRRGGAERRRRGQACLVAACGGGTSRERRAIGGYTGRQGLDHEYPAGIAVEGSDLQREFAAERRIEGRIGPRRPADLFPRQDHGGRRRHHRQRYARLSDGDQFGGSERRMGFRAARVAGALQDYFRAKQDHAARPYRAAQRQRGRLAVGLERRHHPAGRDRQRTAADLQPRRHRHALRHRQAARAADAGRLQQRRHRRRRNRQYRLFGRTASDTRFCRDAHVGIRAEADMAHPDRSRSARMGDRPGRTRLGSAHRGRRQFAGPKPFTARTAYSR